MQGRPKEVNDQLGIQSVGSHRVYFGAFWLCSARSKELLSLEFVLYMMFYSSASLMESIF